jgi:AraC-like DNA-binding protein
MQYEEQKPSLALIDLVDRFWAFDVMDQDPAQVDHVVMPDGTCNLTLIEPGPGGKIFAALTGPQAVALRVPVFKGVRYRGMRLQPGALRAFTGLDVALIVGKNVAVESILPDWYAALSSEMSPLPQSLAEFSARAERLFTDRARCTDMLDVAVQRLVAILVKSEGDVPLGALLESFGLSERQLRRRFVAQVGLTPKVFSRLRRVRRACADLLQNAPAGIAPISYEHGFSDQAHLSREVRTVFGTSPQLLHHYLSQIQHTNVAELNRVD